MSEGKKLKIKLYERPNVLRDKLGIQAAELKDKEGHIDPDSIEEADKLIAELCESCSETIAEHLVVLTECWQEMREIAEQTPRREELSVKIFTLAHEIKDVGSMCGYELAAYFGESLRDYIAQTELSLDAQRVIIQAHVDAMNVVSKQGMKDEGGPAADELKKMVKIAIEKYS